MKTNLYAHTGSGNHGCEALVRSTAKLLDRMPTLFSTGYDEDIQFGISEIANVQRDTVVSVPRRSAAYVAAACQTKLTKRTTLFTQFARRDLLDAVQSGDLCLSIGGDNYCYAGTEILGDLNTLFKKKGAKTVLWGCSIDPEAISPEMVKDLKRYDLITVREPLTQAALAAAGITENVRSVADPAFLLDVQKTDLPDGFLAGNTIGLNLSPLILHYTEKKEEALAGFQALVQHILDITDSTIALITHVVKTKNNDLDVLEPLFKQFENTGRVILVPDQNCMQLKYIISQCRLFIGARTHATIAAYSTCVPTLVIGYSVKSRGIATDLFETEENYVVPIQTIKSDRELISAFDWLEANANTIKQHLQSVIPAYQEKARMGKAYLDILINIFPER